MIFKVVLISAIILLLVFLLRLAFHVKKKENPRRNINNTIIC